MTKPPALRKTKIELRFKGISMIVFLLLIASIKAMISIFRESRLWTYRLFSVIFIIIYLACTEDNINGGSQPDPILDHFELIYG